MKLETRVYLCMALMCLAALTATMAISNIIVGRDRRSELADTEILTASLDETVEAGFYVCIYNGYVAVFENSSDLLPITVTDISYSSLTEVDRDLLMKGMNLEDKTDVLILLEDLGS